MAGLASTHAGWAPPGGSTTPHLESHTWHLAESAGGISPPAAHRTGRTPLEVPGSWHPCSRARLRTDLTGSSHSRWLAQLGCPGHPAPLAPLALPSFPATTRRSAPVLCVRYSTSRWSTT